MPDNAAYRLSAPAKINLSLDVVGLRPDGYHELRTVMQTIPLQDVLTVTHGGDELSFSTNLSFIAPESDISRKAALAFYRKLGREPEGLTVSTEKHIPVGAGLGGGSSDGAALLLHLNRYHHEPLTGDELCQVAASVGADLPFFVRAGLAAGENVPFAALCEGIGERIAPVPALRGFLLALVKPKVSLSTAAMFRFLDTQRNREHPDTDGLLAALEAGDLRGAASRCFNSMERAAAFKCREIAEYADFLRTHGALGACMSGSGSTVFGIFAPGAEERLDPVLAGAFPAAERFLLPIL